MTDEKICPISLANAQFIRCIKDDCMAWVPEKTFYYACTLDLLNQQHGDCKIHDSVEIPEEPQEVTCDGCEYYKQIKCKPVPAHCPLVKERL